MALDAWCSTFTFTFTWLSNSAQFVVALVCLFVVCCWNYLRLKLDEGLNLKYIGLFFSFPLKVSHIFACILNLDVVCCSLSIVHLISMMPIMLNKWRMNSRHQTRKFLLNEMKWENGNGGEKEKKGKRKTAEQCDITIQYNTMQFNKIQWNMQWKHFISTHVISFSCLWVEWIWFGLVWAEIGWNENRFSIKKGGEKKKRNWNHVKSINFDFWYLITDYTKVCKKKHIAHGRRNMSKFLGKNSWWNNVECWIWNLEFRLKWNHFLIHSFHFSTFEFQVGSISFLLLNLNY